MLIAAVNPVFQTIFKGTKAYDYDIVVGEGQPFGNYVNYGGPYLGFMATKKKFMRKLPGRIVGMTTDADGKRAFVLTLQAREQHIRREKATSNICSNQALCATRATIFMSLLGKKGLKKMALANIRQTKKLEEILKKHGFMRKFEGAYFNEMVIERFNIDEIADKLKEKGIILGLKLEPYFGEEFKNCYLVCATEKRNDEELKILDNALSEVVK